MKSFITFFIITVTATASAQHTADVSPFIHVQRRALFEGPEIVSFSPVEDGSKSTQSRIDYAVGVRAEISGESEILSLNTSLYSTWSKTSYRTRGITAARPEYTYLQSRGIGIDIGSNLRILKINAFTFRFCAGIDGQFQTVSKNYNENFVSGHELLQDDKHHFIFNSLSGVRVSVARINLSALVYHRFTRDVAQGPPRWKGGNTFIQSRTSFALRLGYTILQEKTLKRTDRNR